MNQILKDTVYGKGTKRQLEFLAHIGGMNEEEYMVLKNIHDRKTDSYIQDTMGLSRKAYDRVEESVRAKLLIAIFECINCHMEEYEKGSE